MLSTSRFITLIYYKAECKYQYLFCMQVWPLVGIIVGMNICIRITSFLSFIKHVAWCVCTHTPCKGEIDYYLKRSFYEHFFMLSLIISKVRFWILKAWLVSTVPSFHKISACIYGVKICKINIAFTNAVVPSCVLTKYVIFQI